MYAYDELDRTLINERVSEFRDQVKRRLSGELTEDEFKQHLLTTGLMTSLPTPPDPATRQTFQPVKIEGEPISETIIRERR